MPYVAAPGAAASTAPRDDAATASREAAASDAAARLEMPGGPARSLNQFVTTASSRGDDDMRGSDSWKLHSDDASSSASSRATTPEPHSPPRSRPSLSTSTADIRRSQATRTPAIPIPGAVPPPPIPHPPPAQHIYRAARLRHILESPSLGGANRRYVPNARRQPLSQTFPSTDRFSKHPAGSSIASRGTSLQLLSPDQKLSTNLSTISLPTLHKTKTPAIPHRQIPRGHVSPRGSFSGLPFGAESNGDGDVQKRGGEFLGTKQHHILSSHPSSWAEVSAKSCNSESNSEEDLIAYRNARQFPPQLPADISSHMSTRRSRSSATNRITNWVSRYERSYGPARRRVSEAAASVSSQGPESETTYSQTSTDSSHAEVEQLWQRLKMKRSKLQNIRSDMARIRQELRSLRLEKDEADNAFVTVIRPLLVGQRSEAFSSSLKLLDARMAYMLDRRQDYHFSEASYERLERELDEEEKELNGLETRFFSLLSAGQDGQDGPLPAPTPKPATDTMHGVENGTPYELLGISGDKPSEDIHPLYAEFSAAVGDLENAKDDYNDLLFVRSQYEDEKELRASTGLGMTPDAVAFFAEFPSDEARMKTAVATLEGKVQKLQQLCQEKKAMKKHMSIQMAYTLNPSVAYEDLDLGSTAEILEKHHSVAHPRYSELLSQPNHVLAKPMPMTAEQALRAATRLPVDDPSKSEKQRLAAKEYTIETLIKGYDSDSKANLVNRWLLHQLRLSSLNILLLQSLFGSSRGLNIRDYWRWQCDVMYYWWRDSTAEQGEADNPAVSTTDLSELSGRQHTPQPSRAASDGDGRANRKAVRCFKSSEMLRVL
ncbi:uncharacterized protein UV8b_05961 [Ustilaginoidea virens]|uniref:Uncharacterized protein n=1 Tax=Ustilaginoidea virens TaxID=1159556 RepID=A0A063BRR5_USTVR|nr:uncharacterized protein UV8b_05961 [Ustilaginoidea virens]QUC21718.1 hypothetical protein UV8b_05961 [Ustilaginoidea virens]GAO19956.1 hypothetical protein UVI_02051820 [Ustilaginoidea virens]